MAPAADQWEGSKDPAHGARPWNTDYDRCFDGRQWTSHIHRTVKRQAIIGPLLILAGITAGVFFLRSHPSVNVPLAGSQDCGGPSWRPGMFSASD